jgi:hypothetical protein
MYKELLYKWKISDTPHCNACGTLETYEHFFIKCACLHSFWLKIGRVLEQIGFSDKLVSLKSIVLCYRVENRGYSEINYFLTVLGFSIYKSYYVSELRTKQIDTYKLMKREMLYRLKIMRYRGITLGTVFNALPNLM